MEQEDLQTCGGCSCAPSNGTCPVTVRGYEDASCQGQPFDLEGGDWCWQISPNGNAWLSNIPTAPDTPAGCSSPATSIAPEVKPMCSIAEPGTCSNGRVCVPPLFDGLKACVLVADGALCPSGYDHLEQVFVGGTDCTCGCILGPQQCAAPAVQVSSSSNNCYPPQTTVVIAGSCVAIGFLDSLTVPGSVPSTASCEPWATLNGATAYGLCCEP